MDTSISDNLISKKEVKRKSPLSDLYKNTSKKKIYLYLQQKKEPTKLEDAKNKCYQKPRNT